MTTALLIGIPLWLLAATAITFLFLKIKQERKELLELQKDKEPGIQLSYLPEETDVWVIDHPFEVDVLVQIIPNNDALSGASLPYVERVMRLPGRIEVHFTKKVHNFAAVIVGAYAEIRNELS